MSKITLNKSNKQTLEIYTQKISGLLPMTDNRTKIILTDNTKHIVLHKIEEVQELLK